MAGHSKWAGIKHKKAVIDAKRGKLFTKLAKEIAIATKLGGPDKDSNPRLRTAINKAKSYSMPNDNIDRAIKRGSGELANLSYEEIRYEGYGPNGIAVLIDVLTDNRNRIVAEIRSVFNKIGGELAQTGAVGWIFKRKGIIFVSKENIDLDKLMELAMEYNAIDIIEEKEIIEINTNPEDLDNLAEKLEIEKYKVESSEISMVADNTINIENHDDLNKVIKLIETLEDLDDVQSVYTNLDN